MLNRLKNLLRPAERSYRPERITLGGRAFDSIGESTIEHDVHFQALVSRSHLRNVSMNPNESPEMFADRIVDLTIESGLLFEMLGCLIVPAGTAGEDWTQEMGAETAAFLKRLTSDEDKAVFRSLCGSLLIDFFASGRASITTSPTYSTRVEGTRPDAATQPPIASASGVI